MQLPKALRNKKGQGIQLGPIAALISAGLLLVVLVIVLSFGATVVNEVKKSQTVNSTAENISQAGLGALNKFGDFLQTVAIIIVAGAILAILIGAFAFVRLRG